MHGIPNINVNIYIIPCVNPTGWAENKRRNYQDIDINRDMQNLVSKEAQIVRKIMIQRKYDLHLDCHSFGKISTFLIISANDRSDMFGEGIMNLFGYTHPIKRTSFKKKKKYKLVGDGVFRTSNSGTLKGFTSDIGTTYSFTIEAPRNLDLTEQIEGTFETNYTIHKQLELSKN